VALVYGKADVAYQEHTYKVFAQEMEEEGMRVTAYPLEGAPHFLSVTHCEKYVSSSPASRPYEAKLLYLHVQTQSANRRVRTIRLDWASRTTGTNASCRLHDALNCIRQRASQRRLDGGVGL